MRYRFLLFPVFLATAATLTGCHNPAEPPRAVPGNWEKWQKEGVSFRFPKEELALTTRNIDIDDVQVFMETRGTPRKLLLCLEFGDMLPCPVMGKTKSLGQSKSVRIGHFDAERFGPGFDGTGAFGEGLLDLGGHGHFVRAHFSYANLNVAEQDMVETIVASLNKSH